jgi:hypothetical protein
MVRSGIFPIHRADKILKLIRRRMSDGSRGRGIHHVQPRLKQRNDGYYTLSVSYMRGVIQGVWIRCELEIYYCGMLEIPWS